MKTYGKETYNTFQIRLTDEENKAVTNFIKSFKKTRREFILAVINELSDATVIRNNSFWINDKDFAYSNSSIYNKNKPENCELCNNKYRRENDYVLNAHHYLGYSGKNAFKVKQLCKRCHGFCHRMENHRAPWEVVLENFKKWNGKTREEEQLEELNNLNNLNKLK